MHKIIIITSLLAIAITAFAQTEIDWWVFDGGGGMRSPAVGDSVWVSIGQNAIGLSSSVPANLGAGYLFVLDGSVVKIPEEPGENGKETKLPYVFGINSASPNPFNPTCAIEFEVENNEPVTFEFYNMMGNRIDTPIDNERMAPGRYKLTWGGDLPSGNYFARLSSNGKSVTKRIVYLK